MGARISAVPRGQADSLIAPRDWFIEAISQLDIAKYATQAGDSGSALAAIDKARKILAVDILDLK